MPTKKYYTQADFSRLVGISTASSNKLFKGRFKDIISRGKIDITNPLTKEYLDDRGVKQGASIPTPQQSKKPTNKPTGKLPVPPGQKISGDSDFPWEEIENLTVKDVVARYGGMTGFKIFIDSLKGMADWKNKELKYLRDRGVVVRINPLADNLFSLVDLAFKRIVGEFPGAVAPQLKAIVKTGKEDDIINMTALMEKELSLILRNCKSKIIQDLESEKRRAKLN